MLWVPKELAHDRGALGLTGNGKAFLVYPLNDRAVALFAAVNPPDQAEPLEDRKAHLRTLFSEFGRTAQEMIGLVKDPKEIFRDDMRHVELPNWHKDRVVLTGDAAHAMSPILGMGASMALEDSFVLAQELRDKENLPKALVGYQTRRQRRMIGMKKTAAHIERWIITSGPLSTLRDLITPLIPTRYFLGPLEKVLNERI